MEGPNHGGGRPVLMKLEVSSVLLALFSSRSWSECSCRCIFGRLRVTVSFSHSSSVVVVFIFIKPPAENKGHYWKELTDRFTQLGIDL